MSRKIKPCIFIEIRSFFFYLSKHHTRTSSSKVWVDLELRQILVHKNLISGHFPIKCFYNMEQAWNLWSNLHFQLQTEFLTNFRIVKHDWKQITCVSIWFIWVSRSHRFQNTSKFSLSNYWICNNFVNFCLLIASFCRYSQTCSNDHLYKMTTCLRRPTMSPPKPVPIQSLLYKTTTCLRWPATTFFVFQMKKNHV